MISRRSSVVSSLSASKNFCFYHGFALVFRERSLLNLIVSQRYVLQRIEEHHSNFTSPMTET